jgi:hypothetical protein
VIWFFERYGERLKYEICRDEPGEGYLLVTSTRDGGKQVEHVDEPKALIERSVGQMRRLHDKGWRTR